MVYKLVTVKTKQTVYPGDNLQGLRNGKLYQLRHWGYADGSTKPGNDAPVYVVPHGEFANPFCHSVQMSASDFGLVVSK